MEDCDYPCSTHTLTNAGQMVAGKGELDSGVFSLEW